ncbi:MAG: hypothetical protein SGILL_004557 [Bacillariaceae sp.]
MDIVHPAYVTNKHYYELIDPDKVTVPDWIPPEEMHPCDLQSTMLKGCFPSSPNTNTSFYDIERRRRIRHIYYAMISEFDAMVGAYVDAVRTKLPKDVADNTVFILTSDHGDMQMEHQQHYKQVPYDASSSVPMVIYDPRRSNKQDKEKNQIVANPTQLIDIYPTIMALAGVPSSLIPSDLDGHSLLPLMEEDVDTTDATSSSAKSERPNFVVSQYHGDKTSMSWFLIVEPMPCVGMRYRQLRLEKNANTVTEEECTMKYVVWGTGNEVDSMLFDLSNDPNEHTNLIHRKDYATIVRTLDTQLRSVVDYESVALDVAKYNQLSMKHWINATENWKELLADDKLRWHRSWEAAGTEDAIETIETWLAGEPKVLACRDSLVWPSEDAADTTTVANIGVASLGFIVDASSSSTSTHSSIPRSAERPGSSSFGEHSRFPPWNPSPQIDSNGFLLPKYYRIPGEFEKEARLRKKEQLSLSQSSPATIRQVPGDGNCLFHSISTCYAHAVNGTHIDLRSPETMKWLYAHSTKLRQLAVDCLEERVGRKLLFLQGHEYLKARDLVEAAASQYGISGKEYCKLMRKDSYWGGGPEIVALCNVLQRPIHVYELSVLPKERSLSSFLSRRRRKTEKDADIIRKAAAKNGIHEDLAAQQGFVLRRMACFGSPKYDKRPPLHILSADSRFPDVQPGKHLASGNHFLAIFPEQIRRRQESEKKQRIRGGDNRRRGRGVAEEEEEEEEEPSGFWSRIWGML